MHQEKRGSRRSGRQRTLPLLGLLVCSLLVPALASAQPPAGSGSSTTSAVDAKKAQEHFQRAKELYQAGSYQETIKELETARKLDPNAKDLVMNLGIVYEKLGKYDEALTSLREFLAMNGVTPAEKTKVEGMIKRIEGAKQKAPPTEPTTSPPPTASTTAAPPPPPPENGRIDALTVTAAGIAALGLVGGSALGVYALSQRPSDFVTGRDGTYADLEDQTSSAHTIAIVADVGLVIGVVAGIAAGWLYFGRPKETQTGSGGNATPSKAAASSGAGGNLPFRFTF